MLFVGLIGSGDIAKQHARAYFSLQGVELSYIYDIDQKKAEQFAAVYGCKPCASIEKLLQCDIDIIDICSPDALHGTHSEAALAAGKHVLCEKPISLLYQDGLKAVTRAKESKKIFMVGHVLRFFSEYRWIKEYLSNGSLGTIQAVNGWRLNSYPAWRQWFMNPQLSGGAVVDLFIHDADFCHWLLGEVSSVTAEGVKDKYGIWNHAQILMSFINCASGFIEVSYNMPSDYTSDFFLRVSCEKGVVEYKKNQNPTIVVYHKEQGSFSPSIEMKDPFIEEISYFIECVKENRQPEMMLPEDALYGLSITRAAIRSMEQGGKRITLIKQ